MALPSLVTPTWTDLVAGTGAEITIPSQPYTDASYTTAIVVIAVRTATVAVNSVSFGPLAMTKRQEVSNGSDIKISIWDITGASLDTVDVVASLSGSTAYQAFCSFITSSLSYRGGDTNSGTSANASVTTSAGSGTLLIGVGANGDAAAANLVDIANQTLWYAVNSATIGMSSAYKTSRTTGASFGWTLDAGSKPWVTAYIEYNQLPTNLAVDSSINPTLTDNTLITPGFVERETMQVDTTVEDAVEVLK